MRIAPFFLATVLTACGQSQTSQEVDASEVSIPGVDELAANPDRLKRLRQECRMDRPKLGDVLCNRVSEATRKRFYGNGETPYTQQNESPKL